MKCRIMQHFIWVLTVCICGRLGVSCKQRAKSGSVPFWMISLDQKKLISNGLDPDQAQLNVGPYHDPSFLTFCA